jgi:hypothetical protein
MQTAALVRQSTRAEFFHENGYLRFDVAALNADRIIADVAPLYRGKTRVQDAWRRLASVRALACNEAIMALVSELIGCRVFPFQTLNFRRGTEQDLHRDSTYFDTVPSGLMAGVWVAFEDMDLGNGPLRFFPGSHRGETGAQELGIMREGEAIIWHAHLLHGGSPIADAGRTRHSQATHYYAAGCSYIQPHRGIAKQPTDIRDGRAVPSYYLGRKSPPAVRTRAEEWVRNLTGHVPRR